MNILSQEGSASMEQVVGRSIRICCQLHLLSIALFALAQVVPFPTEEELELHTAIPTWDPSIVIPSDHVVVIVGLSYGPQ